MDRVDTGRGGRRYCDPMGSDSVLVANRGEIALRIVRAAAELGLRSVAVYAEDDAGGLAVRRADEARPLPGAGPRAYLDAEQLVAAARETGCALVHPGYGFLSERADFARACAGAGLVFVGPSPEALEELGDKTRARRLAARLGIPVLPGRDEPVDAEQARDFLNGLGEGGAAVLKAVAGGGGRGLRVVSRPDEVGAAWERCRSEARAAFGRGDVYVEALLPGARHVEVQVAGDDRGDVVCLGERECSLQRRHQKLVEWAPAVGLGEDLRAQLASAALRMARELRYTGLGTFEFLVGARGPEPGAGGGFFLEANARLQVEHTVTEEVTGVDLVQLQLALARGAGLAELGLGPDELPAPRGAAVQVRVNLEAPGENGVLRPTAGTLTAFEPPGGPGVRVDTCGHVGFEARANFDSLLAKLVVRGPALADAVVRARRALAEFRVAGVETNLPFLRALLARDEVARGRVHTRFVEEHAEALLAAALPEAPRGGAPDRAPAAAAAAPPEPPPRPAARPVAAPLQGTLVSMEVDEGEVVPAGAPLAVIEAMKMEHVVAAPCACRVLRWTAGRGETVAEGRTLGWLEELDGAPEEARAEAAADPERIRPDLREALDRHVLGLDAARPEAVERRRSRGQRTARENLADLCDPDSFREYGALAIASQRRRRELDELVRRTPADGMLCGTARVNGGLFHPSRTACAVVAYDYSVLAGTQGFQNHRKKDRIFEIAREQRLPVVIFTEGGGGRPGDTDAPGVAALDCRAFRLFGELSGEVPLVGINSGRCFAGNAALLGCCDVVIATRDSCIGMGGPAMIEGGGLGVFRPEDVGPMRDQVPNGVVDVAVEDEAEAVAVARRYLGYFQGTLERFEAADPKHLRTLVPENRLRVYDVRTVVQTLADTDSVLELRRGFGAGMVTALARVEGRPLGIVANDPAHLGGAIDPEGCDKAARFLQLCDAFDLPVLFLCDTPGFMVGPEVERRALVRHAGRLFVMGASLSVPFFTIVLRKGYGLGAQAMAGGSFHAPLFTVAWPTGEFGGMGLEGAVKLGFRRELEAVEDPAERQQLFEEMVARSYQIGKAVNVASHFEIDDVIDPADSRLWIASALAAAPSPAPYRRPGGKRPCVDTW